MKTLFPPATKRLCILCAISLIVFVIMATEGNGPIGVPALSLRFLICILLEIILVPVVIIYSIVVIIKEKTLFSVMCLLVYILVIIGIISS